MMKDLVLRLLFVIVLLLMLYIKSSLYLFTALLILWIVSYRDFFKMNKKVLKSIVLFNGSVSLGYIIMRILRDLEIWDYLVYINLKVYLLTYFVFYFFSKVDMVKFFSFSKELSYLLSISLSQIISYKKSYEDFKLAFKARVVKRVREREKGFIMRVFKFFYEKAMADAKERTLGMKARGFF